MEPIDVILWVGAIVFAATAIITILALLGVIKNLGGGDRATHDGYMKALFYTLIVEIVAASVTAFGVAIAEEGDLVESYADQVASLNADLANAQQQALESQRLQDRLAAALPGFRIEAADSLLLEPLPRPDRLDARMDTLRRSVRATSDGSRGRVREDIEIPEGWEYVDHSTRVRSRNGDSDFDVQLLPSRDGVRTVSVIASADAGAMAFLKGRAWIEVEARVVVREIITDR